MSIQGSKRVTLCPPVALLSQPIEFLLLGVSDAPAALGHASLATWTCHVISVCFH
jgi:hypothetical protein